MKRLIINTTKTNKSNWKDCYVTVQTRRLVYKCPCDGCKRFDAKLVSKGVQIEKYIG